MLQIIEIFSFVTGIVYVVMQIIQHKWMWYVDIMTCVSAIIVNSFNHLWGVSLLNAYFTVMAVVGIFNWRRMRQGVQKDDAQSIKISRLTPKILFISIGLAAVLTTVFYFILNYTDDPNPVLDSLTFSLSIIAAWWLAKAYLVQWLAWIAADIIGLGLYLSQGLQWMSSLYIAYILSSIIGFITWKKKGEYV